VGQQRSQRVVGLFAGVGGIELGLSKGAGASARHLCELEPAAQGVLQAHFDADLSSDVLDMRTLPTCEIVTAGFPCQDLSQAGRNAGIRGEKSGLVDEVFRLLAGASHKPDWLVLENVPFMLRLDRGEAMRYLTQHLGEMGMRWAYRIVDSRAFGVPQRRRRVLLVASWDHDPRTVLFGQDAGPPTALIEERVATGFYWTEGNTGLGWAPNCIPTLKGGSNLGIPSPPAIWMTDDRIVTPDIRDAERFQGFEPDWTLPALGVDGVKRGARWKMVGNAVCVPMATWLGTRLNASPVEVEWGMEIPMNGSTKWPTAAWGEGDKSWELNLSEFPVQMPSKDLADFLEYETHPLSERATRGFLTRLQRSRLRRPPEFDAALEAHLEGFA